MILLFILGIYLLGVFLARTIGFAALRTNSANYGWGEAWYYDEDRKFIRFFCLFSWIGLAVVLQDAGFHGFKWK